MTAQRPTWCDIDLSAVTDNVATLRGIVGPSVSIFVCLKGDACGCGDIEVGRAVEAAGVEGIAFGNLDRALAARRAGLRLPILLYPTCLPEDAPCLEQHALMPTLSTLDDVARWSARATALPVFLKLDGGSFRAGALPNDAAAVARAIVASGTLRLAGVYGHPLAYSEAASPGYTRAQIESCLVALKRIEAAGIQAPLRMISSSATILSHPEADLNAVDPGRLVVGHRFPATAGRERAWRHALVGLRSRLVMVKSLADPGVPIPAPYFPLRPGMRLGLIPFGWGDGYPRVLPATAAALVRGRRVPLLGPPHSELMRIDLTDVPEAEVGDEVVLLGRSGGEQISIHELAAQWQVDVLDLYLAVGKSVRRVYRG